MIIYNLCAVYQHRIYGNERNSIFFLLARFFFAIFLVLSFQWNFIIYIGLVSILILIFFVAIIFQIFIV